MTVHMLIRKIKEYFLKRELKDCEGFIIGGYENCMVRILGKRFLDNWEVVLVHKWVIEGKIVELGKWSVLSHSTKKTYTSKTYRLLK